MGVTISKQARKPVLAAARQGNMEGVDSALARLNPKQLEDVRTLACGPWHNELGPHVELLLTRVDIRFRALTESTPEAAPLTETSSALQRRGPNQAAKPKQAANTQPKRGSAESSGR